nr:sigma-70 family RNA polymerase sigma factor [Sedimentibacter sp.]
MDSDINHIIQQSLKGDKNFQEILLKKLRPLIYKNIYKYWRVWDSDVEDLAQEGYIEILMSLKSFDCRRNVHYLHYIKIRLEYFYKNQYRKYRFAANKNSFCDYPHDHNAAARLRTIDHDTEREEKYELMKSMQTLSLEEQEIIYAYYFMGHSMKFISANLGIKYASAMSRKRKALTKLRIQMCRG